jgi:protein-S-isoprenylcysteine O-methyltransferase Ste14
MTDAGGDAPEQPAGDQRSDSPGVITTPPLIYLLFLVPGIALELWFPVGLLPNFAQYIVGFALIATSVVLLPLVFQRFRATGINLDVHKPTTTIIKDGPYRFSRNSAYLSMTLLSLGIAVAADSVWMLGSLIPVLVVMHYVVIVREEYLCYKRSVRSWF